MSSAKAVWFAGPRNVELRDIEVGRPGRGEALIATELSGISAGTEILAYRGLIPVHLEPDLPTVEGGFGFPIKFGYASVGRVAALGQDVPGLAEGQRVFALHPHQTLFTLPVDLVVPLPLEVTAEDGVFFANLETAFNVVLDAHPRLGETIAIFGQGVVGLLITALMRRAGLGDIVVIDPLPLRREAALQMGAGQALDPAEASPGRLRDIAGGRGIDLAIEASGSEQALQTAIDSLAFQGTAVVCAWYGSKRVTLELGSCFHRERLRIVSSQVSRVDPSLAPRWDRARRTETVLRLLPKLGPSKLITHRLPLSAAASAYRLLDDRPEDALQVVFTYDGP